MTPEPGDLDQPEGRSRDAGGGPEPVTSVFSGHPGPDPGLLDDCVHCGFCLPTCPTYQLWDEEMDSPRGRIWLMELLRDGHAELDEVVVGHFDACLGCMACVTSCPSGVAYDRLIEATRAGVESQHRRPLRERALRRLVFTLFPHPRRLRAAVWAAWAYQRLGVRRLARRSGIVRRLPPRLQALEALLPDLRAADLRLRLPERVAARGPQRRRVALLTGCVQSVLFARVNAATARVLASEGCEVLIPRGQGCCGALELHTGKEDGATVRAQRLVDQLAGAEVDAIVTNAAGCGSTLKGYGHLLAGDPARAEQAARLAAQVRDVHELLAELEPQGRYGAVPARVAYHDACHLAHAQGVRSQPRALLRRIPGLELCALPEWEICCGSAGVYNLLEPDAAGELGRRKAAIVRAESPDMLASANPGCLLQLGHHLGADGGTPMPLHHPMELLDASLHRRVPFRR